MASDRTKSRPKILADHARMGKRFIPPFIHKLGNLTHISWYKLILPEVLWVALIQRKMGPRTGVHIVTEIARAAREVRDGSFFYVSLSSFTTLTEHEQGELVLKLGDRGLLCQVQEVLSPLVCYYPECSLSYIYPSRYDFSRQNLSEVQDLVGVLFDKSARETILTMATVIAIALESGRVKFTKESSLGNLPEIEKYPDTEESKKVAALIRAMIQTFFTGTAYPEESNWPRYFWNRGLEISKCAFREE